MLQDTKSTYRNLYAFLYISAFVYANNEVAGRKIKKTIPFTISHTHKNCKMCTLEPFRFCVAIQVIFL